MGVVAANSNVNYAGVGGKRRRSKSVRRNGSTWKNGVKCVHGACPRKRGGFIRAGSVQQLITPRGKLA